MWLFPSLKNMTLFSDLRERQKKILNIKDCNKIKTKNRHLHICYFFQKCIIGTREIAVNYCRTHRWLIIQSIWKFLENSRLDYIIHVAQLQMRMTFLSYDSDIKCYRGGGRRAPQNNILTIFMSDKTSVASHVKRKSGYLAEVKSIAEPPRSPATHLLNRSFLAKRRRLSIVKNAWSANDRTNDHGESEGLIPQSWNLLRFSNKFFRHKNQRRIALILQTQ